MPKIVVATDHPAEFSELAETLAGLGWEAVSPDDSEAAGLPYDQGGSAHRDQAVNRARAFAEKAGTPALALASAYQVYALDQAPGPRTRNYAGDGASDAEHRKKLLDAMARIPTGQRIALFQATAALAIPGEERVRATSSTLECEVPTEERGEGGFLFDSVTQIVDKRTLAELDDEERNRLSHRGMAMKQMARHLNELAARGA